MDDTAWPSTLPLARAASFCSRQSDNNTDPHHHQHHQSDEEVSSGEQDIDAQVTRDALRKDREERVRTIQRDNTITFAEKQRRIHSIMCDLQSQRQEQNQVRKRPRTRMSEEETEDCSGHHHRVHVENSTKVWWHHEENQVLGCKHYARKCRMKAACCGDYVGCRLCHDEMYGSDHKIDRTATKQVMCMVCGEKDLPAGEKCANCGVKFADYHCDKCKFWVSGEKASQIYHCDACGLCRTGKDLCKHCDKCGVCVPKAKFDVHPCVEKMVDRSCPICTEYLANSTKTVLQLKHCGHVIHLECLLQHCSLRYTCPVCMKAIVDMKSLFRVMDQMMEREWRNLPTEYAAWVSKVYCQDCYKSSDARFHFVYHRCGHCSSYNTRVDQVVKQTASELIKSARATHKLLSDDSRYSKPDKDDH